MEYRIINVDGDLVKTLTSIEEVNELFNYSSSYHSEIVSSSGVLESYYWYPIDDTQMQEYREASPVDTDINKIFFVLTEEHWNIHQSKEL